MFLKRYVLKRTILHNKTKKPVSIRIATNRTKGGKLLSPLLRRPLQVRSLPGRTSEQAARRLRTALLLKRAPLISDRGPNERTRKHSLLKTYRDAKAIVRDLNPANHLHCLKRHMRRTALFAIGIAGHNKHKSPGRGGSYTRTKESERGC